MMLGRDNFACNATSICLFSKYDFMALLRTTIQINNFVSNGTDNKRQTACSVVRKLHSRGCETVEIYLGKVEKQHH